MPGRPSSSAGVTLAFTNSVHDSLAASIPLRGTHKLPMCRMESGQPTAQRENLTDLIDIDSNLSIWVSLIHQNLAEFFRIPILCCCEEQVEFLLGLVTK